MNKNISNKRTPPFSIRLNTEERAELERRAERAGLTIGGYCKSVIFDTKPPRRSRRPPVEKKELARLLGEIGRLGNNLNQIARILNFESSVDLSELKTALNDLAVLRASVLMALGYTDSEDKSHHSDGRFRRDH